MCSGSLINHGPPVDNCWPKPTFSNGLEVGKTLGYQAAKALLAQKVPAEMNLEKN